MLHLFNVWDFIERFKEMCRRRGWGVYRDEDLIYDGSNYHHLVLVRRTYFETFRRIISTTYQSIKDGNSYRIVNVSYIAWISEGALPRSVVEFLARRPDLLERVALYDLSPLQSNRHICLIINRTGSIVFRELEDFLTRNGLRLTSIE